MVEQAKMTESTTPDSGSSSSMQALVFVANCENKEQAQHVISTVKEYTKSECAQSCVLIFESSHFF